MALAHRFAQQQGYGVSANPKIEPHFWAICGDSEFNEGSLHEAIPDFSERELGNVCWILDYNRQSLDGHRIANEKKYGGRDYVRISKSMKANRWQVLDVQHGSFRKKLFQQEGGKFFQSFIENRSDYEIQSMLLIESAEVLKSFMKRKAEDRETKHFIQKAQATHLRQALHDMGGHDISVLVEALLESKKDPKTPTIIIVHTIKGWGLKCMAQFFQSFCFARKERDGSLENKRGY